MITPVLQTFLRRKSALIFGLTLIPLAALTIWHKYFLYVMLYVVAYYVSKHELVLKKTLSAGLGFISIIVLAYFSWDRLLEDEKYSMAFHLVISATIVVAFIQLCYKIRKWLFVPSVMRLLDRYSYELYICHHFIILGPFSLLYITNSPFVNMLIITCLTCFQAFLLKEITQRFTNYISLGDNH